MKDILVTGGAGFIGSNFVRYLLRTDRAIRVVDLDALTYAGDLENLRPVCDDPRHIFVEGDICDRELVGRLFAQYRFDTVVNFAAESHVDRSIEQPETFLRTNVLGTQALLDAARASWRPDPKGACAQGVRFLQVSTDEVYGTLGKEGKFTEQTPLAPNSPYSASKASADMMVRAYHKTYGLPVNITRCSNNYGPYQFPEKLIPLMLRKCLQGERLPVYGDGLQVRDWLYVEDHCSAILAVLERGRAGEVYNIGGNSEKTNLEIVRLILRAVGKDETWISHVDDRLGHDRRYAIDSTKIAEELGWRPSRTFEQGMEQTIRWYLAHQGWLDHAIARLSDGKAP